MIKDLAKTGIEHLNQHKVGWGTAIAIVAVLMWGSYQLGLYGWELLHTEFITVAQASEHVTWYQMEIREKNKNIRMMTGQIQDYKIQKTLTVTTDETKAEIDAAIIRLEGNIESEKEAIKCLKSENDRVCDF